MSKARSFYTVFLPRTAGERPEVRAGGRGRPALGAQEMDPLLRQRHCRQGATVGHNLYCVRPM
jgi:hypothetical protein